MSIDQSPTAARLFADLPIGARFLCRGRRYVKLALSMAEDEDRTGTIFMDDVKVELGDGEQNPS
ncbi:hypothetical protein SBV1_370086 [Verrucomicrobia bacterium]|nr:hypothetical protein SBV1_370086 [Verrucomicrobiota bacterium]